jgi:two-component system sensor histidine kinase RegB
MTPNETHPTRDAERLRLDTLIRLRWLAVIGQTFALLLVGWWLGFDLPLGPCFTVVAASVWLNVFLRLRNPPTKRLTEAQAVVYLGYDVAQLAALLFLTGGLLNPFVILFLAPVMVSATSLRPQATLILGGLVLVLAAALGRWHWPLPWYGGTEFQTPLLYLMGIWMALASTMVFMAHYAFRVSQEARLLSDALMATELVLAREQHISQLDGLAAAAAHELGTPLGTITLIANDLRRDLATHPVHGEDVKLLAEQARRCREILSKLTAMKTEGDAHFDRMALSHLIEEVVDPHRGADVTIDVALDGEGPEPVGRRNPGVLYGLGNILENAADFATGRITVTARWTPTTVVVMVEDDGPGFAAEIIDRLGEPYVTTRGRDLRRGIEGDFNVGLGLGFFIAKTLLERSGATLRFENRRLPALGARVRIVWPREALEAGDEANANLVVDAASQGRTIPAT